MSTTDTTTTKPLAVQMLDLLAKHYGEPQAGGQVTEMNVAVSKLIAVAAQQRAMRQMWQHEAGCWDRLKAELNTPQQQGAH